MYSKQLTLILLLFICNSLNLFTQVNGGTNEKLRELYNLDRFEDCLFKADKMTQSSKYSKDPEPYLYVAMCFHKISFIDPEELDNEYSDPLRDALKFALKYKYKDRNKELYEQNKEFFSDLKMTSVVRANSSVDVGNYREASSVLNTLIRVEEDNPGLELFKGICDIRNRNKSGNRFIEKALDSLRIASSDTLYHTTIDDGTKEALTSGTLLFCNTLEEENMKDSSKYVIKLVHTILPESDVIEQEYYKIWGIEKENPKFKNGFEVQYKTSVSDKNQPIPVDSTYKDSLNSAEKIETLPLQDTSENIIEEGL